MTSNFRLISAALPGLLALHAGALQAQPASSAPAPAPASALAPASAPVSAAKKELLARVLKLHQSGLENLGRTLAEQPVQQLAVGVRAALARVPQDKRESVAREIEADMRRYLEDTVPLVRERAVALGPSTLGPILEQRFSEDELRQIIKMLESPVNLKYQAIAAEMQRALGTKLFADTRAAVEPRLKALEQALENRLRAAIPAASAAGK